MTHATLIVPTRGGAERLPRLFDALAAQTHPEWDAVVVIDGDIDGSQQVVERHAHLPIRAVVLPENRGRVTALNTGFAQAEGDILIRCDDDFEPGPGHVAAHVEGHASGPRGVVGLPLNIAPANAYMRAYGLVADARGRDEAYATAPEQRWRLWGGNTSLPRDLFHELGGFDARYRGYGWEDLDLGYRLHRLGVPIELSRAAEVRHHMASVNTRTRALRALHSGMARRRFDEIHGPGISGPAAPPGETVWNRAVLAASRVLNQRSVPVAAGAVDAALAALPVPVGRKLVALTVEASAVAGYRAAGSVADPRP